MIQTIRDRWLSLLGISGPPGYKILKDKTVPLSQEE